MCVCEYVCMCVWVYVCMHVLHVPGTCSINYTCTLQARRLACVPLPHLLLLCSVLEMTLEVSMVGMSSEAWEERRTDWQLLESWVGRGRRGEGRRGEGRRGGGEVARRERLKVLWCRSNRTPYAGNHIRSSHIFTSYHMPRPASDIHCVCTAREAIPY